MSVAASKRLAKLRHRDGGVCAWCGCVPAVDDAAVSWLFEEDYVPKNNVNAVYACGDCVHARGDTRPAAWLLACSEKGYSVNWQAVETSLRALHKGVMMPRLVRPQLRELAVIELAVLEDSHLPRVRVREHGLCVWCGVTPEDGGVLDMLLVGAWAPTHASNAVLACHNCANARAGAAPAKWSLDCAAAGNAVSWETVDSCLRTMHSQRALLVTRDHRQTLRRHAATEFTMLMRTRLPYESARIARLRKLETRDGSGCVWCAKPLSASDLDCTVEHLLPRAHGGSNQTGNLVCACFTCNQARGKTKLKEWLWRCRRRGLKPRYQVIESALSTLAASGGQSAKAAAAELQSIHTISWFSDVSESSTMLTS